MSTQVQSEIERFILNDLLAGSRTSLDPNEPLTASGIIDSLGTLRLITFLEETFGVTIRDGDVGDENFGTLNRLSAFIDYKRNEKGSSTSAI